MIGAGLCETLDTVACFTCVCSKGTVNAKKYDSSHFLLGLHNSC